MTNSEEVVLIRKIERLEKENDKLKAEIDELTEQNKVLSKKYKFKNGSHELQEKEIEQLRKELKCIRNENSELKSELEQSVKLQNVLSKLLKGSEFARCYMCDNSMKNITLDGKNNGCDGSCYHAKEYTKEDLLNKIKCEIERSNK